MRLIVRLIPGLVLLASLIAPVRSETTAQLISGARLLALDAASSTRQRFSDADILKFLNQGQREALTVTRCLRQSTSFQLVTGTTYYSLPSNYLAMERLTVGTKYLQEMSPAGLDGRSRAWEAASGYPTYYFVNFASPTVVGFAPWPAQSTDTDTVKMEFDVQATDLAVGTDVPFNGVATMFDYHHALAYFAAAMMSAIEGQPQRQQLYQGVYAAVVAAMAKRCLDRPNYLPSGTGSP